MRFDRFSNTATSGELC